MSRPAVAGTGLVLALVGALLLSGAAVLAGDGRTEDPVLIKVHFEKPDGSPSDISLTIADENHTLVEKRNEASDIRLGASDHPPFAATWTLEYTVGDTIYHYDFPMDLRNRTPFNVRIWLVDFIGKDGYGWNPRVIASEDGHSYGEVNVDGNETGFWASMDQGDNSGGFLLAGFVLDRDLRSVPNTELTQFQIDDHQVGLRDIGYARRGDALAAIPIVATFRDKAPSRVLLSASVRPIDPGATAGAIRRTWHDGEATVVDGTQPVPRSFPGTIVRGGGLVALTHPDLPDGLPINPRLAPGTVAMLDVRRTVLPTTYQAVCVAQESGASTRSIVVRNDGENKLLHMEIDPAGGGPRWILIALRPIDQVTQVVDGRSLVATPDYPTRTTAEATFVLIRSVAATVEVSYRTPSPVGLEVPRSVDVVAGNSTDFNITLQSTAIVPVQVRLSTAMSPWSWELPTTEPNVTVGPGASRIVPVHLTAPPEAAGSMPVLTITAGAEGTDAATAIIGVHVISSPPPAPLPVKPPVQPPPGTSGTRPPGPLAVPPVRLPPATTLAFFASTVGLAVFLGFLTTEIGKYGFLKYLTPLFLYSRLRQEEALDNFIRAKIYKFVETEPGTHYSEILLALRLTNGVLAHHLSTLEREKFITSMRDGQFRRFYPMSMKVPRKEIDGLSWFQLDILDTIRTRQGTKGVTPKEIAAIMRQSKQVINYHLNQLLRANLVERVREGRWTYYFVEPKDLHRMKGIPATGIPIAVPDQGPPSLPSPNGGTPGTGAPAPTAGLGGPPDLMDPGRPPGPML